MGEWQRNDIPAVFQSILLGGVWFRVSWWLLLAVSSLFYTYAFLFLTYSALGVALLIKWSRNEWSKIIKKQRNKVVNGQETEFGGWEGDTFPWRIILIRCALLRVANYPDCHLYSAILDSLHPVTVGEVCSRFLFHFWHLKIQQLLYKNGLFQIQDLQIKLDKL